MYDVLVIGAGPAGITAGIYAVRNKLNAIVLEKNYIGGGQILNTLQIDNYPALPNISGIQLAKDMRHHAETLGVVFKTAEVTGIADNGNSKIVQTVSEDFETKTVLIATGTSHRMLNVPGETAFLGKGVSYCATCDGVFFKEKTVAVIGGGNAAVQYAIFLARICPKVHLVHRRDTLRADRALQEQLLSLSTVQIHWNSTVQAISGTNTVTSIDLADTQTGSLSTLHVQGIFIAAGLVPNTKPFLELVRTNKEGFIEAAEDCKTSCAGIFAAGDVRTKPMRQIVTALSDGATAIASIEQYMLAISGNK